MYPRSAIKTYKGGGVNPVGAEQPYIYKDPPSAKFTRKYEPVNDFEIQTFIRPDSEFGDPTRINEGINYFARGQNPMVKVSYSNVGAAQTNSSMGNFQASNPYKIEVVRPPMYPIESLVPISAPRIHQNYSIQTNPGMAPIGVAGFYDKNSIRNATATDTIQGLIRSNPSLEYLSQLGQDGRDTIQLNAETLKGELRPTAVYNLDLTREANSDANLRSKATREMPMNFGVNTSTSFSNVVLVDTRNNTSIDVGANVKEKNYIAVSAAAGLPIVFNTNDGQTIKVKDYTYSVVQPNVSNSQMIIQINQPDIKLERNMPLFAANTNLQMGNTNTGVDKFRETYNNYELESPLMTSATTNLTMRTGYNDQGAREGQHTIQLDKLSVFGDTGNRSSNFRGMGERPMVPLGKHSSTNKFNDMMKNVRLISDGHHAVEPKLVR
jgi:hypothetical protein